MGITFNIKFTLGKRHIYFLSLVFGIFIGVLAVNAYNSGGIGGNPAVFGHSVDEMDWSKQIPGSISVRDNAVVSGRVGIGTASPAYPLDVNGDIIVRGLLRTTGSNGWYSQDYGGGWYMGDTTWIRATNDKGIYTRGQAYIGSTATVGGDLAVSGQGAVNGIFTARSDFVAVNNRNGGGCAWTDESSMGIEVNCASGQYVSGIECHGHDTFCRVYCCYL